MNAQRAVEGREKEFFARQPCGHLNPISNHLIHDVDANKAEWVGRHLIAVYERPPSGRDANDVDRQEKNEQPRQHGVCNR